MQDENGPMALATARAQDYRERGPGRVKADRLTGVDQVGLLRRCRETLTDVERAQVQSTMTEISEILHGVEQTTAYKGPESVMTRIWRILVSPLAGGASKERRKEYEYNNMLRASGKSDLPAPKGMIEAAEAWLVATMTQDRVGDDITALLRPWETIAIE